MTITEERHLATDQAAEHLTSLLGSPESESSADLVSLACRQVADLPAVLPSLDDGAITTVFAQLMRLRALAEGAALGALVQAMQRGAIGASDYAGPSAWVRGVAADLGDTVVPTGMASAMARTAAAAGAGLGEGAAGSRIVELAIEGRVGATQAAPIVREFAAMRRQLPPLMWDVASQILVEQVAHGASPKEIAAAHEAIVASYGDEGQYQQKDRVRRDLRSFGEFRPDSVGMYTAQLRLDPESYAAVEAVIGAYCKPDPCVRDEDGAVLDRDVRDRQQRRADALVEVLTHAGTDPTASTRPGTAARSQLIVMLDLDDLAAAGIAGSGDAGEPMPMTGRVDADADDCEAGAAGPAAAATAAAATATATATRDLRTDAGSDIEAAAATSTTASLDVDCDVGSTGRIDRGQGSLVDLAQHPQASEAVGRRRGGGARTEHGQPVPAAFLRRLACTADLTPVVLGAEGDVLWAGRRVRYATGRQLAALWVRDRGCTFPGCARPPSWCQAHHIVPWFDGGPTDIDNLALLCERHHHVVHSCAYTATATTSGVTWHLGRRGPAAAATFSRRAWKRPAPFPTAGDVLDRLEVLASVDLASRSSGAQAGAASSRGGW